METEFVTSPTAALNNVLLNAEYDTITNIQFFTGGRRVSVSL